MSLLNPSKKNAAAFLGSAFLMATSAIGPGFITQTTVFTEQLFTSFAFVILCSIVIDIVVQLNVWRVISVSGMRTQDAANRVVRGSGYVLTALIAFGGLAFNIGNLAGAGLGWQVVTGLDVWHGVILSALVALFIFSRRDTGSILDHFTKILGGVMILLMVYIAIRSNPPVGQALYHTFLPEVIDTTAILVLVGGTVGGYISFAGVHRLLDAGISGPAHVRQVSQSSVKGILLASTMRLLLFMAALGVVASGVKLDPDNPAATVFSSAAGEIGYVIFGIVLWSASITSVVGSAYTSVSFLQTFHPVLAKRRAVLLSGFVCISAVIFLIVGRPVTILVVVGALNAFVLPLALIIVLMVSKRQDLMQGYRHPAWLVYTGWVVAAALIGMSLWTIGKFF
jgi:Mn2+/Fe2+ NRAMP family transporter